MLDARPFSASEPVICIMIDPHDYQSMSDRERLSAYADDQLAPQERAAFEEQLQGDRQLRAQLELDRKITASLKRTFAAPTLPAEFQQQLSSGSAEGGVVTRDAKTDPARSRRRMIFAAIAASLVWVLVGWRWYQISTSDGYERLALADIYQATVDEGFQPDWVCEDDRVFAETFQRRQGKPLGLLPIDGGRMVGLSYLKGLSPRATSMLALVDEQPVIVFVERIDRHSAPANPSWRSGLQLFRKNLDGLALYELTPLDEPRVLDSFEVVELPPAAGEPVRKPRS